MQQRFVSEVVFFTLYRFLRLLQFALPEHDSMTAGEWNCSMW
jgi:hypothetical protein